MIDIEKPIRVHVDGVVRKAIHVIPTSAYTVLIVWKVGLANSSQFAEFSLSTGKVTESRDYSRWAGLYITNPETVVVNITDYFPYLTRIEGPTIREAIKQGDPFYKKCFFMDIEDWNHYSKVAEQYRKEMENRQAVQRKTLEDMYKKYKGDPN